MESPKETERTCKCCKNTCDYCEGWWAARALNPPPLGLVDNDVVYRECQRCGYEIPDPYDQKGQRPVTCSSCDAVYSPKTLEGNDLPATCVCAEYFLAHGGLGWPLSECDAHKCWPPTIKKLTSARQGNLF